MNIGYMLNGSKRLVSFSGYDNGNVVMYFNSLLFIYLDDRTENFHLLIPSTNGLNSQGYTGRSKRAQTLSLLNG